MAKRKRNSYGSIIHEGGFTITQKELKELKQLTTKANNQRKSSINKFMEAIHYDNAMRNVTSKGRAEQLENKGYINEKFKTSLGQFKTKKELKEHLSDLKEITSRGYWNRQLAETKNDMFNKIFEKTDDIKLARAINNLSYEEITSINLANPSFREAIWDSDQKLTTEEWREKIKNEYNRFMRNRAQFKGIKFKEME